MTSARSTTGVARPLQLRPAESVRWDLVALGEVLLRLDPGEDRVHIARMFRASEGGGEYNVARGLRRAFGLRTAVITALVDNPVGRLLEDLMLQGGVDHSHLRWLPFDGVGRAARNGLNFTERGFGLRAARGTYDRGNSAASQMCPGAVDWDEIFGQEGARWFHCGGAFAALSETTPAVAHEAMSAARRHGTIVSYDLNFRPSLWREIGGRERAREVNGALASLVDVMFGNEEDFSEALGFDVEGVDGSYLRLDTTHYGRMMAAVAGRYPNIKVVATTLRAAHTATSNDWGAACWADGRLELATHRPGLEIFDRVGGGDSFASGFIYGLLKGLEPQRALEYGAAHGALAMTTRGDTSTASLAEVEAVIRGAGARVER